MFQIRKVGEKDGIAHLDTRHSREGGNIAPGFRFSGAPADTVELALICHDPDAPRAHGFTHWVIYGIPPEADAIGPDHSFRTGPNGIGEYEYIGPRPPAGHGIHHYFFTLYALNTHVIGEPTREEFLATYASKVVGVARWVGLYESEAQ